MLRLLEGLRIEVARQLVGMQLAPRRLELHDAPADFHGGRGAMIRMIFPEVSTGSAGAEEGNPGNEIVGQVN